MTAGIFKTGHEISRYFRKSGGPMNGPSRSYAPALHDLTFLQSPRSG